MIGHRRREQGGDGGGHAIAVATQQEGKCPLPLGLRPSNPQIPTASESTDWVVNS